MIKLRKNPNIPILGILFLLSGVLFGPTILTCSATSLLFIQMAKQQALKDQGRISKYFRPYGVKGVVYYPLENSKGFSQKGLASWYGKRFHGEYTSNREQFNMYSLTAAHKTLPFNSLVRVTHLESGKEIVVRINDRGPFVKNRIIDLSYKAAKLLGLVKEGIAKVRISIIEPYKKGPGNPKTLNNLP